MVPPDMKVIIVDLCGSSMYMHLYIYVFQHSQNLASKLRNNTTFKPGTALLFYRIFTSKKIEVAHLERWF